jgi:hypothetical protein
VTGRVIALSDVVGASVEVDGLRVGVVCDIYADPAAARAIGFGVTGPGGRRWFLPWVAATIAGGAVSSASPLVFIPADQLDFYVRHGTCVLDGDVDSFSAAADGVLVRSSDGATP